MECFRIDESGYTGFDLLNPEAAPGGVGALQNFKVTYPADFELAARLLRMRT